MKLYKGIDYLQVSSEDLLEYEKIRDSELLHPTATGMLKDVRVNKFHEYPKSVRHNNHLFPNNYLDIVELQQHDRIRKIARDFKNLLNTNPNEQTVLNFINDNEYYIIIASLFTYYNFGHHEAYLFKEFSLNTQYRADYLLVGKGSGGYEFVFIELESPSNNPFKNKGTELSQYYQNGINQVKSWERFLEQQFSSLQPKFLEAKQRDKNLRSEFINNDSSRRHYIVVAGRRKHYETNSDYTYSIRRQEEKNARIKLLHYDNMIDLTQNLIGKNTY
ncbi:Shedu anti-phage system protein SduA domain-containing protein [Lysinibacillus agricola]|uniref:Shedu anti-phage system protein SduA domain-containing protein n=1 Tax=Lysinibacillus agricola TaxID=2590012 RepID=UPI003C1D0747